MDEYMRLFFAGEALQRALVCMCNGRIRDVQYKISKIISSMLRSTICIRMTPMGLAPFRDDINMVIPYSTMDHSQLEFLDHIMQTSHFGSGGGAPTCAMCMGDDVVTVTTLDGVRVWSDSSRDRAPLTHSNAVADEASRTVDGVPLGGGTQWHIDTMDLLKAFVSCVFRSTVFTDDDTRTGVCDIVIQMVIHDVGLTQNMVDMLRVFIHGIRARKPQAGCGGNVTGMK